MFANKGNIDSTGNNTINNTGERAQFEINHYANPQQILNKTYLYGFCVKFSEVEDTAESYDTEIASDIEEKMDYNEIDLYKEIFLNVTIISMMLKQYWKKYREDKEYFLK